ncbi:MAG: LPS export ABC transporter periplasmic protein LptC, partial [Bradyrhizobium sp.]|nr:LPS export ABC transporter periplasmic protein LptC [Bradyrhizobium sp.]
MNSAHNVTYDAALAAKFASAARHSRLVRILRVAVPATVAAAMGLLVLISTIFNPFQIPVKLDSGNLVVTGTKITMESPHMSGFTPDQRPYELWAKTATQDITDPDHVDLHDLRAKVLMEDQSTLFLDARTGRFDNKQQQLDLHKDIFLRTS